MFCAAFYYTQQLLSAVHESQQLLHAFTQIYRNTHFYVAPAPSIEGNITCYTPFICPMPIANLKMENFTTLKLRVDVTHIRNNWKRNFEVKSSMVKVSGNVKIVLGAHLRKNCIDLHTTKTGTTPITCCTFRPI